jgi:hypothetical protein
MVVGRLFAVLGLVRPGLVDGISDLLGGGVGPFSLRTFIRHFQILEVMSCFFSLSPFSHALKLARQLRRHGDSRRFRAFHKTQPATQLSDFRSKPFSLVECLNPIRLYFYFSTFTLFDILYRERSTSLHLYKCQPVCET